MTLPDGSPTRINADGFLNDHWEIMACPASRVPPLGVLPLATDS
jgi:hypothetical protein